MHMQYECKEALIHSDLKVSLDELGLPEALLILEDIEPKLLLCGHTCVTIKDILEDVL